MPSTPETPLTPLGAQLRAGRTRAGLSIRQAARLATPKLSPTTWTTLETGTRAAQGARVPANPSPTVIMSAARVVDLDVTEALRLAGYDPRHWTSPPADTPPADERPLAERIALLDGTQLDAVAAVVHGFLATRRTDSEGDAA